MPRPMSCLYFPLSCTIRIGITILSIALLPLLRIITGLLSGTRPRARMGLLSGQLLRIAPTPARPCAPGIGLHLALR